MAKALRYSHVQIALLIIGLVIVFATYVMTTFRNFDATVLSVTKGFYKTLASQRIKQQKQSA